jgi:adenine deaminase
MQTRSEAIAAALGLRPFDLLVENVRLVNVYTREVYPASIGIAGGFIAHVGPDTWDGVEPKQRLAGDGRFAVPGFIDTHVHIESSMMSPAGFAAAVLPRGTTTVVIDPHEIANVVGLRGVKYMIDATRALPLRVFVQAPSCVPAVPGLETAGADFGPSEMAEMLSWPEVIGVAEVMDYLGVIHQGQRMSDILAVALAHNTVISGHCPGLRGDQLAAYLVGGPASDHEGKNVDELREKLRMGMTVEGRASTFSESMSTLAQLVIEFEHVPPNLVMCTDDILPDDLLHRGHMDRVVRIAVDSGFHPVDAIRAATLHGAQRHRLYDLGAIAPGKRADLVLTSSLEKFAADEVIADGILVARQGQMVMALPSERFELDVENTVRLPHPPTRDDFGLRARPARSHERVRVLTLVPASRNALETVELPVVNGLVDVTGAPGIVLLTILERHGRGGQRATALLQGLGLQRGAVASTVSHDSHNLTVVGRSVDDMVLAAQELAKCGGGVCCAESGRVVSLVPLPIGGLMSPLPLEDLAPQLEAFNNALRNMGINRSNPLAAIIGLALPVIPFYSMTDHGLVDVERQTVISMWADEE